ncbi:MAG: cytochrome d ubiquinol oxidase subunit II, partial [Leeuwenhoekiella sp.]
EINGFYAYFIDPWFNLFSFSIGLFICILSAYLASIFLLGEAKDEEVYEIITVFARRLLLASIVSGGLIFLTSYLDGFDFYSRFFSHTPSIISFVIASLLIPFILIYTKKRNIWMLRILSGLQVIFILSGWFLLHWPNIITFADGASLNIYEAAAPQSVMKVLFWALLIGSCLIFPSLYYLFRVFKFKE